MGLFNFSKYNDTEKALRDQYVQMMTITMGIDSSEALETVEGMLNQAIKESKKDYSYYLPQNFGDILLGDIDADNSKIKKTSEAVRKKLPRKKEEGVCDEDIRWWWNLNDIERRMMLKQDEVMKLALYMEELQKGKTYEEAMAEVRKFHPVYGDPDDTTHTKGDDRPLPHELKDRINIYIEKRAQSDSEKYKKDIEQSSTFNALIRKEIKANNV